MPSAFVLRSLGPLCGGVTRIKKQRHHRSKACANCDASVPTPPTRTTNATTTNTTSAPCQRIHTHAAPCMITEKPSQSEICAGYTAVGPNPPCTFAHISSKRQEGRSTRNLVATRRCASSTMFHTAANCCNSDGGLDPTIKMNLDTKKYRCPSTATSWRSQLRQKQELPPPSNALDEGNLRRALAVHPSSRRPKPRPAGHVA